MFSSILAICIGASAGATSRWLLGLALDSIFQPIPIGTLTANLIGGYLTGVFMSFFAFFPAVSPEWRLFVLTGFLGSLTTFSTFSTEVVTLLQQGHYALASGAAALHLFGSILMTILGAASFVILKSFL